jgi:predicted O-methyltransferase YrrM
MIKSILGRARDRFLEGVARQSDLGRLYEQLAGLQQIRSAMEGTPVLRPMRGWAISPDALAWVLAAVQEYDSPTMLEFGSGQSTVALAATLKRRGGRLISVEHDPEYLSGIQRQIQACGLADAIQFVTATLIRNPDEILSYDIKQIPETTVDLVLIDGPPIAICGTDTRLVPLRWAANHLSPGGTIFLDDSNRPSEQACLERLSSEVSGLQIISRTSEKGLAELRIG